MLRLSTSGARKDAGRREVRRPGGQDDPVAVRRDVVGVADVGGVEGGRAQRPDLDLDADLAQLGGDHLGDVDAARRVGHGQHGGEAVGLPAGLQRRRVRRSRSGRGSGSSGPPCERRAATARDRRTALTGAAELRPAPPAGRSTAATAARQSALSIGRDVGGQRQQPHRAGGHVVHPAAHGVVLVLGGEPGGGRRPATPVPVMSMSADPASRAWSRSTPLSPVRTTTWSGSAVRTVVGRRVPLRIAVEQDPGRRVDGGDRYGPGGDRVACRSRRPVSASIGTGLLEGSAMHERAVRLRGAQPEDDRAVVGGLDRRQARADRAPRPGTARRTGCPGRPAGRRRSVGPPTMTSEANDRSMPYLTSRDVIGRPFSNRTPSRRVNVQLSPSSDTVPRSVARSGTSSSVCPGSVL